MDCAADKTNACRGGSAKFCPKHNLQRKLLGKAHENLLISYNAQEIEGDMVRKRSKTCDEQCGIQAKLSRMSEQINVETNSFCHDMSAEVIWDDVDDNRNKNATNIGKICYNLRSGPHSKVVKHSSARLSKEDRNVKCLLTKKECKAALRLGESTAQARERRKKDRDGKLRKRSDETESIKCMRRNKNSTCMQTRRAKV